MKKRVSRDLAVFAILVPLFLWGAFYISSGMEDELPAYSVLNKSRSGFSVFFEALRELKYPVERTLGTVDAQDPESIQIVAGDSWSFFAGSEEVKEWIGKGGVLIHLTPGNISTVEYATSSEDIETGKLYRYRKGIVITSDLTGFTNRALMKETGEAYALLEQLEAYRGRKIYFNENHLYGTAYEKSLWDYLPVEVKFLLYQAMIVLVAFFCYKGRRFGKAVPFYEEAERIENEYLYSAASLYRQAKSWDLMLENYYREFLKQIGRTHGDWLEYWQVNGLPSQDKARRVYEFMHDMQKKPNTKEYIQIVTILEQLGSILRRRRDTYWKALKKTT